MSSDNNSRAVAVRDEKAIARQDVSLAIEKVVVMGDLKDLNPEQRVAHYKATCQAVGVDWIARPFDYIATEGKLILYANQNCASQLRDARKVSSKLLSREEAGDLYIVTALATLPDGRSEEATGAVSLVVEGGEWKTAQSGKRYFAGTGQWTKIRGTDLANAIMKAETKAKRRATFNLCGLGAFADESFGEAVDVETTTGEIVQPDPRDQQPLQVPKAASPRFHTRRPEPVVIEAEAAEAAQVEAEGGAAEETEPAPMPEEMARLLKGIVSAYFQAAPLTWQNDPKKRAVAGKEVSDRLLKLFTFSLPEALALLCACQFAATGEIITGEEAPKLVDARWLAYLQVAAAEVIESLHEVARWWLQHRTEVPA